MLALRIAESVSEMIPMDAAVFVFGGLGRMFSPNGFPPEHLLALQRRMEGSPSLLNELARSNGAAPEPRWMSDGSLAFMLPLVHNGMLEGVLCLHRKSADCHDTLLVQVKSLAPVCQMAAAAIVRTMEQESVKRAKKRDAEGSDARSVVVTRLLRNIAHDIRTPTTALRGYVKMVMEGRVGEITADQKECLEVAFRSANQLVNLGNMVEEAAAVLEDVKVESLDLRDLWSSACNANRPQVLAAGVTIKEILPAERVSVTGDRAALTSVLEGVLAFALEGIEAGCEIRADLTGSGRSDATLRLELPRNARREDAMRQETFLRLRNRLFLHGGNLTLGNKGEQAVFTISLPGQAV
jgi:signal transduction histidine kinase